MEFENLEFETLDGKWDTYKVKHSISQTVLQNVELESYVDYTSKELLLTLEAHVFGADLQKIQYPTNWVEAIKDRFAPRWLLRKHPVRYVTIQAEALYPTIPYNDSTLQPIVKFTELNLGGDINER